MPCRGSLSLPPVFQTGDRDNVIRLTSGTKAADREGAGKCVSDAGGVGGAYLASSCSRVLMSQMGLVAVMAVKPGGQEASGSNEHSRQR